MTAGIEPYYTDDTLTLLLGDATAVMSTIEPGSVDCAVTSPPYFGLRDYCGNPAQIGIEASPAEYVAKLVTVFREIRRVLADDGTCWLNIGDCYNSTSRQNSIGDAGKSASVGATSNNLQGRVYTPNLPVKSVMGIPWRLAISLQDDGWVLRNAIVWHKPNAMPESVRDRLSTRHEMLFLLTKSPRYWFDLDAIREPHTEATLAAARRSRQPYKAPGQKVNTKSNPLAAKGANPGDVWSINTRPFVDAHFATFPVELPRRCIAAGCKPGGIVLDPFSGAGTTALAAQQLGRRALGIDINAEYHDIALKRMADAPLPFDGEASA